jgi:hypothetical protein
MRRFAGLILDHNMPAPRAVTARTGDESDAMN